MKQALILLPIQAAVACLVVAYIGGAAVLGAPFMLIGAMRGAAKDDNGNAYE